VVEQKQIKIAQVVCTYPPYRGGMGNVAFEYTERLRDRGYNVHVFTTKKQEVEDPKHIHRIPSLIHVGNAGVMPSLYKRLSGFDLVHLHYPFFGGAEPVVVRKAMRKDQGLVLSYHMDAVASGVKGAVFGMHRRLLFPWLIGRVDRILASTKDYAESSALADVHGAMDRLEIHPFGIDLERFRPSDNVFIKESHNIKKTTPVLLFVGGLDPAHHFKGLPILLQTLSSLKSYDWKLLIVGSGSLQQSYAATAEKLGLFDHVVFVGNVSDKDLPKYYSGSDIHVFPSTQRAEAFGLVALEAAASGIPTIASDLPGVRTVVQDGNTGLLVPAGDEEELKKAILLLLEQTDLRKRLGASARARAEAEFHWDPLITKLEQTYCSVLSQQSNRSY